MKTLVKILIILSPLSLWRGAGGEVKAQSWQWATRMGSISTSVNNDIPEETVKDMATDAQGNVYACGRIRSGADFDGTNVTTYGGYDVFLAKYDCHGNLLWAKIAGNPQDGDEAYALALDGMGHVYLTGKVFSDFINHLTFVDSVFTEEVQDMFIAKFDTSGNLIWVKAAAPGPLELGSSGLKMEIDSHGFINVLTLVAIDGMFFPGDTLERGMYIIRFDTAGNVNRVINILDNAYTGLFSDFKISSNEDYYLTGLIPYSLDSITIANHKFYRIASFGASDLFLIKIDSNGTYQWDVHLGKPYVGGIYGNGVSLNAANEVYFTGSIGDSMTLGTDTFYNAYGVTSLFNAFPFAAKFTSQGVPIWAVNISTKYGGISSAGIQVKSNNNAVFAGFFGTNSIIGQDTLTSSGLRDIFLAEISPTGNILQGTKIDGTGDKEYPECITRDANDNIFVGGGFDGTLDINGTLTSSQGGNTDGFIAKWGSICTTGIEENEFLNENDIITYPNPATDILHIKTKDLKSNISISLYNTLGQKTFEKQFKEINGSEYTINLKQLPIGIYYVVVTDGAKRLSSKVLKD